MQGWVQLFCYRSFYRFKGKFCRQTQGVPIGSPLAGVLAELVIRSLEQTLLSNLIEEAVLYTRYVDDDIVIWNLADRSEELQSNFTIPSYGLKLVLEQRATDKIHFLDIEIIVENGNFRTKVFIESYPMYQ